MNTSIIVAKSHAENGAFIFKRAFSHIPDDKLSWSPSETAKSALRIAAHIGLTNQGFASMIRGNNSPFGSVNELLEMLDDKERGYTTKDAALSLVDSFLTEVLSAIESLAPDQLATEVKTAFAPLPIGKIMMMPGSHMLLHAGQIEYLQTIWGDTDAYR